MPIAIHSFKIDDDDVIRMCHVFYGVTKSQAEAIQKDHARDCPHYGPALARGQVIDIVEEIAELPQPQTEELLDFLELGEDEDEEEEDEQ